MTTHNHRINRPYTIGTILGLESPSLQCSLQSFLQDVGNEITPKARVAKRWKTKTIRGFGLLKGFIICNLFLMNCG